MVNQVNQIVSTAWLENALHSAGLISNTDRILSYEIQPLALGEFQTARTFTVSMDIVGPAKNAPKSIVLKLPKGQKEHYFFTQLKPRMDMPQLMDCHYGELLDEGNAAVLLLEDLSQSHTQTQWPLPPSESDCVSALSCLAGFHAYWWNHVELPELLTRSKERTHWLQRMQLALDSLPGFMAFLGDRLSDNRKTIFERIITSNNRTWLPEHTAHGSTLLHGDAHFWNFLYDRNGIAKKVKLFDWSSWNVGRATDDLAYMIGLHWYEQHKQLMEVQLLRVYHQQLLESGVDYSWEALLQDYQLSTVVSLLIPVWQWQHGINAVVWWGHLERGFQAFELWKCMELFE